MMDQSYFNTDEEYHEINDFLVKESKSNEYQVWESVRFNFWRYNIHSHKNKDDAFFRENVHIWRDENNSIIGLALSEYGGNDIFIEVSAENVSIYPQILRWVGNEWGRNKNEIEIEMYADDRQKINVMKNHGFTFKCHCENKRIYELEKMDLAYDLRLGYRIVTLSESGNIHNRVALVQKVFDNPGFSIKNVEGLIASPDYNPEYDLTVIDVNSGMHVAYCIGWKDNRDPSLGYIEPVGTHPDFRKMGLAKALLTACFSKMYKAGVTRIKIASEAEPDPSNYFYDSLKPSSKMEVHKYGLCPSDGDLYQHRPSLPLNVGRRSGVSILIHL